MRDWAMGEQAIDVSIAMQAAFAAWWKQTLEHGGDRKSKNQDCKTATLISAADIKAETGISKQHVSRWREALRDWIASDAIAQLPRHCQLPMRGLSELRAWCWASGHPDPPQNDGRNDGVVQTDFSCQQVVQPTR